MLGELLRMPEEVARDLLVCRVEAQCEVGGQHRRQPLLLRVERIRHGRLGVLRDPLVRSSGALGQLVVVTEEVLEEPVAPLRRRAGPGDLDAAGDRVGAFARAVAALPAEAAIAVCSAAAHSARVAAVQCRHRPLRRRPRPRRGSCPSSIRTQPSRSRCRWGRKELVCRVRLAACAHRTADHAAGADWVAAVQCGQRHQCGGGVRCDARWRLFAAIIECPSRATAIGYG